MRGVGGFGCSCGFCAGDAEGSPGDFEGAGQILSSEEDGEVEKHWETGLGALHCCRDAWLVTSPLVGVYVDRRLLGGDITTWRCGMDLSSL